MVFVNKSQIILHPQYDHRTPDHQPTYYDIAVIKLENNLEFGPNIGKIDMIDRGYVAKTGDKITILGYSEPIKGIIISDDLKYVKSEIHDFVECKKLHRRKMVGIFVKYGGSPSEGEKEIRQLDRKMHFCVSLRYDGTHITNGGDSGGKFPWIYQRNFHNE